MGRQVVIYQANKDIEDFWIYLQKRGLVVFDLDKTRKIYKDPVNLGNNLLMKFIYTSDVDLSETQKSEQIRDSVIEYCLPRISCCPRLPTPPQEVKTINLEDGGVLHIPQLPPVTGSPIPDDAIAISDGRFYLPSGAYANKTAVKIYNALIRYIKNSYTRSKNGYCYYGPHFERLYRMGKVIPANGNNVFDFEGYGYLKENL